MGHATVYLIAMLVVLTFGLGFYTHAPAEDILTAAARGEIPEWSATRRCKITPDAADVLVTKVQEAADTIQTKRLKYGLSPPQEQMAIRGITTAYLDEVSVARFGPNRRNCRINAAILANHILPALAKNPDTGILDIDGAEPGAEIYVDGVKKGYIRQSFIVSAGSHLWKTMKCQEQVHVTPNDIKAVYCKKK